MSENRPRELEQLITAMDERLASVKADLHSRSIYTRSDDEVISLQQLQSMLELKLVAAQADLVRVNNDIRAVRYAEDEARREAGWTQRRVERRADSTRERIAELQQLIADPAEPPLSELQKDYARTLGIGAQSYVAGERERQKANWRGELETLKRELAT